MTSIPVSKSLEPVTTELGYSVVVIDIGQGHLIGAYRGESPHEQDGIKNVELSPIEEGHRAAIERRLSTLKYLGPYKFLPF